AGLQHLLYPDRQQGIALCLTERNCRGGEKESRQADVCDYRRWQRAAHCRRRLHEDHGYAAAGRSVPWPGLGLSRRSVGTSRSLLRFHAIGAELHQIWPGQGHRNPYRETKPTSARCADHDGVRRPRSGDRFLDRAIRSDGYATGLTQSMPDLKQRFEAVGGELMAVAPDRLNGILKTDYAPWSPIIREAGIRVEGQDATVQERPFGGWRTPRADEVTE